MNYINIQTNEYPVFETHIINRNKGFDDYRVVYNSEIPQYDTVTQMCVEVSPVKLGEDYFRRYEIINKSEAQIANERKASVPTQITPRQLRLQLLSDSLLDEVETMCNANREMQIWFEYSLDFQRNHPMIEAMGTQLGMSESDMDTFFIEASKL